MIFAKTKIEFKDIFCIDFISTWTCTLFIKKKEDSNKLTEITRIICLKTDYR